MLGCRSQGPSAQSNNSLVGITNEANILVNGTECKALLDTGSTVSTISQTFYDKLSDKVPIKICQNYYM